MTCGGDRAQEFGMRRRQREESLAGLEENSVLNKQSQRRFRRPHREECTGARHTIDESAQE